MTTTIKTADALTVLLIARRHKAYDERAAEFSRRQATLDVAGEAGRDPSSQLLPAEQAMFDGHSQRIRQLDQQIAAADLLIGHKADLTLDPDWARNLGNALLAAADAFNS